jgi:hypothetical protein
MANVTETGIINSTGYPNPNLLRVTAMTSIERSKISFISNSSTDWTQPFRYYNGSTSIHTFSGDTDTILLNANSNLGIAFQRKATDIDLDSTSYYVLSCEAKCTKSGAKLSIGRSYYNTSNAWVWRGGEYTTTFSAVNTWQKFTLKFKPDANTQYIMYCFTVNPGTSGGSDTFTIRHCKLEKGEIATAWIPNENDVIFTRTSGFAEQGDIASIQKKGYIQSPQFIEI